jgi:hypothetical protein
MRSIRSQKKKNIQNILPKEQITNQVSKKTITLRCSELLLTKAKNSLISKQASGDYSLTNFSDLVRQSLLAYQNGMPLTEQREINSPRKVIAICLDNNLLEFYNSLPTGGRSAIFERALASYLLKA